VAPRNPGSMGLGKKNHPTPTRWPQKISDRVITPLIGVKENPGTYSKGDFWWL